MKTGIINRGRKVELYDVLVGVVSLCFSSASTFPNLVDFISLYTERQKKLITSSERHSLKSKASTLIIFGHR